MTIDHCLAQVFFAFNLDNVLASLVLAARLVWFIAVRQHEIAWHLWSLFAGLIWRLATALRRRCLLVEIC